MIIKKMNIKKYEQIKHQRKMAMSPEIRKQGYYCTDNKPYYREIYLKSNEWRLLRDNCLKKYPKCNLCGNDAVDCHHVNYESFYDVKENDVRSLCRDCHSYIHKLVNSGKLKFKRLNNSHGRWLATIRIIIYWKLLENGLKWKEAKENVDKIMDKFISDRKIANPNTIYVLDMDGNIRKERFVVNV